MATNFRMVALFFKADNVVSFLLLLHHICEGKLSLTGSQGACGKETRLICTGVGIHAGDPNIWYKRDSYGNITTTIAYNNQAIGEKYLGESRNGMTTLVIKQTNNSDAGMYTCSHNFEDSNAFEVTQTCNSGAPSKPAYSFCGLNLGPILGLILVFLLEMVIL